MSGPDPHPLPEYAEIAATLQRCAAAHTPAEAHGFALGLCIAGIAQPLQAWQRELYSDFDPADVSADACRAMLDRLFASVVADMKQDGWELALLLPQDLVVSNERLSALRDWCQGFLYGFGLGGEALGTRLSPQTGELLHDIAEFTRLDTAVAENDAENQAALIEIEEYLRVGVMLIRDELRATDAP